MRILLDTHILLWWLKDDRRLSDAAVNIIEDATNDIFMSTVNAWEIAIKKSLRRIQIDMDEFLESIKNSGLGVLNITVNHACQISNLPDHHKDPFDRMLIAQSIVEPMRLLTHDDTLIQYGKHVLLV
ncbi:MAG: type II toxin-antitoxin system VapC family toxin [Candidatus Scalindua sp.]|jgi:PIN domain nuclease of toxin-antitoxin system